MAGSQGPGGGHTGKPLEDSSSLVSVREGSTARWGLSGGIPGIGQAGQWRGGDILGTAEEGVVRSLQVSVW